MAFRQELCTHFASPECFALYTDHCRLVVKILVLTPTVPKYYGVYETLLQEWVTIKFGSLISKIDNKLVGCVH
jgi:hypothetical protein